MHCGKISPLLCPIKFKVLTAPLLYLYFFFSGNLTRFYCVKEPLTIPLGLVLFGTNPKTPLIRGIVLVL